MPNRIVREGINSSSRINALSFGAELLYRRLLSVADDYGRFYASPSTVRGACWPTAPEKACEQDVSKWISECAQGARPLISLYVVDGCAYLQITDFKQQTRSKSKFPEPDIGLIADCEQLLSTSRSRISESDTKSESKTGAARPLVSVIDEKYTEFRESCLWLDLIESDFDKFTAVQWGRLDIVQRNAAIDGMIARREAGYDPRHVPRPKKYLEKREWTRLLRKATGDQESLAERIARA